MKTLTKTTTENYYLGSCPTKGCKSAARVKADTTVRRWTSGRYRRPYDAPAFTIPVLTAHRAPNGGHLNPAEHGWIVNEEAVTIDSLQYPTPQCVEHQRALVFKPVIGTPSAASCDPRCEAATGHQCECSCAGTNHGGAHGA